MSNHGLLIDPGDLLSLYELGKYHWIIGGRSRARQYFERVRQNDAKGQYAERLQQVLAPG